MVKTESLTARQLLAQTYVHLIKKLGAKKIALPEKASAIIADDSDWHRTREGFTGYKTASIFKIKKTNWAIAYGVAWGSYPADPFNCDIACVEIVPAKKKEKNTYTMVNKKIKKLMKIKKMSKYEQAVCDALENNTFFRFSLLYAKASGALAVNQDGPYGKKVLYSIGEKSAEYVSQKLETNPELFTMDLRPVVTKAYRYKPEFVEFLANVFKDIVLSL